MKRHPYRPPNRFILISVAVVEMDDPLSVKQWLFQEVERRKRAGIIPRGRRAATVFARQLEIQMKKDVKAGTCERALPASSIRVRLYDNKLWPPGNAGYKGHDVLIFPRHQGNGNT